MKKQLFPVGMFIDVNQSFVREMPESNIVKLKTSSKAAVVFFMIILCLKEEYMGKMC